MEGPLFYQSLIMINHRQLRTARLIQLAVRGCNFLFTGLYACVRPAILERALYPRRTPPTTPTTGSLPGRSIIMIISQREGRLNVIIACCKCLSGICGCPFNFSNSLRKCFFASVLWSVAKKKHLSATAQLTTQIIYIVTQLIFIMFPLLSEEEINPGIYLHIHCKR